MATQINGYYLGGVLVAPMTTKEQIEHELRDACPDVHFLVESEPPLDDGLPRFSLLISAARHFGEEGYSEAWRRLCEAAEQRLQLRFSVARD